MRKRLKISIFVVTVSIFLLLFLFPHLYSYMFSPISTLLTDIAIGDDYYSAYQKASDFVTNYDNTHGKISKFGFSKPVLYKDKGHGSNGSITISQHFYGEMDGLHVTIYFDNNMKVINKDYRGD